MLSDPCSDVHGVSAHNVMALLFPNILKQFIMLTSSDLKNHWLSWVLTFHASLLSFVNGVSLRGPGWPCMCDLPAEMIRGALYSPNPMAGSHSIAQASLVPASQVLGSQVSVMHTLSSFLVCIEVTMSDFPSSKFFKLKYLKNHFFIYILTCRHTYTQIN